MGRRQVAIEPDKAEEQARERERRKHFMLGRLNDGMAFLRRSYKMEECSRLHSRDASSFPCTDVVTWSQSHGFQMAKRGEGQSAHSEALAKLHLEQRREVADHRVCLNSLASKRRSLDTEIEATQRALDEQQRRQEEGPKCNQEGGPNMIEQQQYQDHITE